MKCTICGKEFKPRDIETVRESWTQAGGWGTIPESAICHPACDKCEQRQLKAGMIKLADLWVKIETGA